MKPLNIEALKLWDDPLSWPPWDCYTPDGVPDGVRFREMVQYCYENSIFEADSYSGILDGHVMDGLPFSLEWHAARVAYLMRTGWNDPIHLVVKEGRVAVQDGNHRFAAAIMLGHNTIMVEASGLECDVTQLLGEGLVNPYEFGAMDDGVQVAESGQTVWVHAFDGSTVGRFDWTFGMDVHTTVTAQLSGASQCLHCTHEPATMQDWNTFCDLVWLRHGIPVDRDIMGEPMSLWTPKPEDDWQASDENTQMMSPAQ